MTVVQLQMLPHCNTGNYLAAISVMLCTSGSERGGGGRDGGGEGAVYFWQRESHVGVRGSCGT